MLLKELNDFQVQNNIFAIIKVIFLKQQWKKGKKKVNQLYDDLSNQHVIKKQMCS